MADVASAPDAVLDNRGRGDGSGGGGGGGGGFGGFGGFGGGGNMTTGVAAAGMIDPLTSASPLASPLAAADAAADAAPPPGVPTTTLGPHGVPTTTLGPHGVRILRYPDAPRAQNNRPKKKEVSSRARARRAAPRSW